MSACGVTITLSGAGGTLGSVHSVVRTCLQQALPQFHLPLTSWKAGMLQHPQDLR